MSFFVLTYMWVWLWFKSWVLTPPLSRHRFFSLLCLDVSTCFLYSSWFVCLLRLCFSAKVSSLLCTLLVRTRSSFLVALFLEILVRLPCFDSCLFFLYACGLPMFYVVCLFSHQLQNSPNVIHAYIICIWSLKGASIKVWGCRVAMFNQNSPQYIIHTKRLESSPKASVSRQGRHIFLLSFFFFCLCML